MNADRKPLAHIDPDPEMLTLRIRITVRYTSADRDKLARGARRRGEELSRYIRRASLTGDSVLQTIAS